MSLKSCLKDQVHWHATIGFRSSNEWLPECESFNGLDGDACAGDHWSEYTTRSAIGRTEFRDRNRANKIWPIRLINLRQGCACEQINLSDDLDSVAAISD